MALQNKQIIAIVAVVIVIAAAAVGIWFATSNNNSNNKSPCDVTYDMDKALSASDLEKIKNDAATNTSKTLTLKNSTYTAVFDNKAIATLTDAAKLSITTVNVSTLDKNVQTLVGSNAVVVDISFGSNTDFGSGKATVSFAYTLPSGTTSKNVAVYYLDSNNKLNYIDNSYSNGTISLTTSHFSKFIVTTNYQDESAKILKQCVTSVKDANLEVYGNINGDMTINQTDADLISALISLGKTADTYKMADANNDGTIDSKDVDVVNSIIKGEKTTVWHTEYYDNNGDGQMDTEVVSTVFPISSTIMTGSANGFMLLNLLNIVDEVKGASYGSTNDTYLYSDSYLDTKHTVKLGTSSTSITFEDGKAGSSDVIKEQHVTALITDWNRTYITNYADFEKAGVDVIRVAAASVDKDVYTNSILLLGFLFQKEDRAQQVVALYDSTFDTINNALSGLKAEQVKSAVASSMTGYLSSGGSDYTKFCEAAGAKFGLEGFDFGTSTSITVADNLGVFDTSKYNYDNIVHIRTALTYASTTSEVAAYWAEYANAMNKWVHAYDGQVLVSGSIPVPLRVAYIAYAVYGDVLPELSLSWADGLKGDYEALYSKSVADAPNHVLALNSYNYTVTISDDVIVTDKDGKVVTSGSQFAYGTTLHIAAKTVKEGFTLRADGSTIDANSDFIVCQNITARYVDDAVIASLEYAGTTLAKEYSGVYGKITAGSEGKFTVSYPYYDGTSKTKDFSFVCYETADLAKSTYNTVQAKIADKSGYTVADLSSYSDAFDGAYMVYNNKVASSGAYVYSMTYLVVYKGTMVLDMASTYLITYSKDAAAIESKVLVDEKQITALFNAIADAMSPLSDKDAVSAAGAFASTYEGVFGKYTADGASASSIVSSKARTISFSTSRCTDAVVSELASSVVTEKYTSDSKWTTITMKSYDGFDNVFVFMRSCPMGEKVVSMLYVTGNIGNVIIDGCTSYAYMTTVCATQDDVNTFLNAIINAVQEDK